MAFEISQLILIVGVVSIVIVGLRALARRRRLGTRKPSFWKSRGRRRYRPWDQEAELLRLCHGDRALAERLIALELERAPKLSRAGAALAAATRLRHDKQ